MHDQLEETMVPLKECNTIVAFLLTFLIINVLAGDLDILQDLHGS